LTVVVIYDIINTTLTERGPKMAQTLKSKLNKLSQAYSITAIIETAKEIQTEQADKMIWDAMSTEEKTQWFLNQCARYNLTPEFIQDWRICVKELKEGTKAYFTVFLPHKDAFRGTESDAWHLEIGGAYIGDNNGGIWTTHPGLKGKERQIAEVIRLHKLGQ
jgi:hypothetical protein